MTQQAFLRLCSNQAAVGADVKSNAEAWVLYDATLADLRVGFCDDPLGIEIEWRALTQQKTPSTKLWNDAYLAAFAKLTNLELVSFDPGLRNFPGLNCTIL